MIDVSLVKNRRCNIYYNSLSRSPQKLNTEIHSCRLVEQHSHGQNISIIKRANSATRSSNVLHFMPQAPVNSSCRLRMQRLYGVLVISIWSVLQQTSFCINKALRLPFWAIYGFRTPVALVALRSMLVHQKRPDEVSLTIPL